MDNLLGNFKRFQDFYLVMNRGVAVGLQNLYLGFTQTLLRRFTAQ